MMFKKVSLSIEARGRQGSNGLEESNLVKILLVQDSIKEAEYTLDLIERLNVINQVLWIRDSQEALNIIDGNGYFEKRNFNSHSKLIICDLDMPEREKVNLLQKMKNKTLNDRMSLVLLLSSYEEKNLLEKAGLSKCKYLFKPVTFSSLKELVWNTDHYYILPTFWEDAEQDILYRMD
jgi:CheY-like chemotaxis protein